MQLRNCFLPLAELLSSAMCNRPSLVHCGNEWLLPPLTAKNSGAEKGNKTEGRSISAFALYVWRESLHNAHYLQTYTRSGLWIWEGPPINKVDVRVCTEPRRERKRATSYPAEGPRLTASPPPLLRLRHRRWKLKKKKKRSPCREFRAAAVASMRRPSDGRRAPMVPGNEVQIRSLGAGRGGIGRGMGALHMGGGSVGYMLRKALLGHPRR